LTREINLNWLRTNRDQLFAEAVELYRARVPWWPERDFEQQTIRAEQDARFESDMWEKAIAEFLDGLDNKKTTLVDIAVGALGYEEKPPQPSRHGEPPPVRGTPINRLGTADQRRITAILVHLGWEPKRDNQERWWQPKVLSLKSSKTI
jgi:predicted P-loop ATPase